jgi:hypothetical protein
VTTTAPRPARRLRLTAIVAVLVLVVVAVVLWLVVRGGEEPDAPAVQVYPSLKTLAASRDTTITLRGDEVDVEGATVTGVKREIYPGEWTEQPDGSGWTFTSSIPFLPGDRVSVETDDMVSGFLVAGPDDGIPQPPFDEGKAEVDDGVERFATRPDLRPPEVEVTTAPPAGVDATENVGGFVFVAPKRGPTQEGPMIVDRDGEVVWFHPVEGDQQAFDFRVQQYEGRDVLTWWQGAVALYRGSGVGKIMDSSYRELASVEMANGYEMDAHEFELTDRGTALVMAYVPVPWDTSSVGGRSDGIVEDNVIQEIDVKTGALLFEWHALGSIGLGESYRPAPKKKGQFHDPYHFNSIQLTPDGDYLVSARHTSALYKIDAETGEIVWRLGGKRSDFKLGAGARFNLQHDARLLEDGTVSLFDNVSEDVKESDELSRGLVLTLDEQAMEANVAREYVHPGVLSGTQGSMQTLGGENAFVGWGGMRREFTEYTAPGEIAWDARFVPEGVESYRAYTMPWSGKPADPPDAVLRGRLLRISWNGATDVTSWRLTPDGGRTETIGRDGFETQVRFPERPSRVQVAGLDEDGDVVGEVAAVQASGG